VFGQNVSFINLVIMLKHTGVNHLKKTSEVSPHHPSTCL